MMRAPYIARFTAKQGGINAFDFILMSIRTEAGKDINKEIKALENDISNARKTNPNEPNIIVVGSFNIEPSLGPNSLWSKTLGNLGLRCANNIENLSEKHRSWDNIAWPLPTYTDYANEQGKDALRISANTNVNNQLIWANFWADND